MNLINKSFDSVTNLFETLWRELPNLTVMKTDEKVIPNLIISSKEFCDLQDKNLIRLKFITEGGFGIVGFLKYEQYTVRASVYSFSRDGRNNVFYSRVIIKVGKYKIKPEIKSVYKNVISINDPLSDMVFGSMLGHLFDIGVLPFVSKYFGNYFCMNSRSAMVLETADLELYQKLNRNKHSTTPSELKSILFQLAYTMFIYKYYFGIVHFDSHLRNIMLIDTSTTDYMYHGKNLKDVKYFLFETTMKDMKYPVVIAINTPKYLLKIIDFGCMMAKLKSSKVLRFKKDITVATDVNDIIKIGALQAFQNAYVNESVLNTLDLTFSLINVFEYLNNGLDGKDNGVGNEKLTNVVNDFFSKLFGISVTNLLQANSEFRIVKGEWFMRNHSTGFTSGFKNLDYIIQGLIKFCKNTTIVDSFPIEHTSLHGKQVKLVYFENDIKISDFVGNFSDKVIYLTHHPSEYETLFNRFEYILANEQICKYKQSRCDVVNFITESSEVQESLVDLKTIFTSKNFKIYMKTSTYYKNPIYEDYNTWLDRNPIPRNRIHKFIEDIRVYLVEIGLPTSSNIFENTRLVDTSNIGVTLGNFAFFNKVAKCLGYFMNKSTNNVYHIPYPNVYNKYLAVFSCSEDNVLQLENYEQFINRHQTVQIRVPLNDSESEMTNVIKHSPKIKLINGNRYNWAITIGPVLVSNKKRIFNSNSHNIVSHNSVGKPIILKDNESEKIFVGSKKGYYGMGDCTELQTRILLVRRGPHFGFVFVEGTFFSPGLDVLSVSKIAANLQVDDAVILSSGRQANLIYKNGIIRSLSKFPYISTQGAVLNIGF